MRMTEKIFTHRRLERAHSAYFDACRGASALAVLFAHAVQLFRPAHATIISCFAGAAVMAFFVLSGFFIHKSLARVYQTRDWGSYVRGRCNRILPPFGACIALTLVLWLTAPILFESGTRAITAPSVRTEFSLEGLWETLAFLNPFVGTTLSANGPLWSLSYEVWYYALAALFALAVAGRRAGWVWLPLLIVLSTLQPWFAVYGGLWACGFLLSALHANGRYIELPRLPYWLVPAVLLAAVAFVPEQLAGKASTLFNLAFGAWFVVHAVQVLARNELPRLAVLSWSASFSYRRPPAFSSGAVWSPPSL